MSNNKATHIIKANWKSIIVGVFMIFVTIKLIQIEKNTNAIDSIEWVLNSIEGDVYNIKKKLEK